MQTFGFTFKRVLSIVLIHVKEVELGLWIVDCCIPSFLKLWNCAKMLCDLAQTLKCGICKHKKFWKSGNVSLQECANVEISECEKRASWCANKKPNAKIKNAVWCILNLCTANSFNVARICIYFGLHITDLQSKIPTCGNVTFVLDMFTFSKHVKIRDQESVCSWFDVLRIFQAFFKIWQCGVTMWTASAPPAVAFFIPSHFHGSPNWKTENARNVCSHVFAFFKDI